MWIFQGERSEVQDGSLGVGRDCADFQCRSIRTVTVGRKGLPRNQPCATAYEMSGGDGRWKLGVRTGELKTTLVVVEPKILQ